MKNLLLSCSCISVFFLYSCHKSDTAASPVLQTKSDNLEILPDGGEQQLEIESNHGWKLNLPEGSAWLTANITSGNGNGTIKLSAPSSQEKSDRTAKLELESTDGTGSKQSITVTQKSHLLWNKTINGTSTEIIQASIKALDGGYIVLTNTSNDDKSVMVVTKVSEDGTSIKWWKGLGIGVGRKILAVNGGYIIAGLRYLSGRWVMAFTKLSADGGAIDWESVDGRPGYSYDMQSVQLSGDEFIVAGTALSLATSKADMHIARISSGGNIVWDAFINKTESEEKIVSVVETENGYAFAARINIGRGYTQTYLARLSKNDRSISWEKILDRGEQGAPVSLIANDGGYIVSGNCPQGIFLTKLTETSAQPVWDKIMQQKKSEYGSQLIATEGGYVVSGSSTAVSGNNNCNLVKISQDGQTLVWDKIIKSLLTPICLMETNDGYIASGIAVEDGKEVAGIAKIRK